VGAAPSVVRGTCYTRKITKTAQKRGGWKELHTLVRQNIYSGLRVPNKIGVSVILNNHGNHEEGDKVAESDKSWAQGDCTEGGRKLVKKRKNQTEIQGNITTDVELRTLMGEERAGGSCSQGGNLLRGGGGGRKNLQRTALDSLLTF